jgi:hypothetical protein
MPLQTALAQVAGLFELHTGWIFIAAPGEWRLVCVTEETDEGTESQYIQIWRKSRLRADRSRTVRLSSRRGVGVLACAALLPPQKLDLLSLDIV